MRNFIKNRRTGAEMTIRWRQFELTCDFLQSRSETSFYFLLHSRPAWHRPRQSRESCGVIEPVNVHQVHAGIEPPRQIFRWLDRPDRHLGEINRHENLANRKSFHGFSIQRSAGPCSALLAKNRAFLAQDNAACLRLLGSMELIPNNRADETKEISNDRRQNNKSKSSDGVERFDDIDRLDHVRPEDEIDDRLRPTQQHENCPN